MEIDKKELNQFIDAGENIKANLSSWTFEGISNNFDVHISNSVPLYFEANQIVIGLTDYFINKNSQILDIGSSTGTLSLGISQRHKKKDNITFILVDEIKDMISKSRNKIKEENKNPSHKFIFNCLNLEEFKFPSNLDIVTSMYTIQFLSPSIRQEIFNRIYQSLNWGGAFFFFEKTNGNDARFHDMLSQNYEDFKIKNGYSINEIKAKQLSLRGVLKPFSSRGNHDLLKRSGFEDIQIIFRYGLFEGILAIK